MILYDGMIVYYKGIPFTYRIKSCYTCWQCYLKTREVFEWFSMGRVIAFCEDSADNYWNYNYLKENAIERKDNNG